MTADDTRAASVALARRTGLEDPDLASRVADADPRELLADALGAASLLPEDPAPLIDAARTELAAWADRGIAVLTVGEEGYPDNLRGVHDRPAILFIAGDPTLLTTRHAIGIVGTRSPTPEGINRAQTLARELVAAGETIVSGLAAGIDIAAHRAAVKAGGRTIAVIGTGHDLAHPAEHRSLQAELARTELVVSSFWPDTPPTADGFRRRNAVISGLARGTVIVEASPRSGTRVLARRALAHGRPVCLLPGLLALPWARELAQRAGVHVVTSAEQVLAILDPHEHPGPLTPPVSWT